MRAHTLGYLQLAPEVEEPGIGFSIAPRGLARARTMITGSHLREESADGARGFPEGRDGA